MENLNNHPDGTTYWSLRKQDEIPLVFRINNYSDLWYLHQYVDAYVNLNSRRPSIYIPNLLDAQADRRFSVGQSFGLKLVCEFLGRMDADFTVFHPHNPAVVEALMGNVTIDNNSNFVGDVLSLLYASEDEAVEKLTLLSADAGGFKPLMAVCSEIGWRGKTYSASKARAPETGDITQMIDKQDFEGQDILIVDDICIYGGTFKGLSTELRKRNCGKLYLAVSHMTIQQHKHDHVGKYFDQVFTTNSKFDEYYEPSTDTCTGQVSQVPMTNVKVLKAFSYE